MHSLDTRAKVPLSWKVRKRLNFWRYSPHGISLDVDPHYARSLERVMATVHPDAIFVEHLYMLQYARFAHSTPVFFSAPDVESLKFARWYDGEPLSLKRRLLHRAQLAAITFYESSLARRAHSVFAVSDVDRNLLQHMNHGRGHFVVAPNGVDLIHFEPRVPSSFNCPPRILFMGTMFYKPNHLAALELVNDIFPLVKREVPEAECHLIGKTDSNNYSSLNAPQRGVHMHGFVDDIRPYLMACQVSIVPVRVGSGTRIKILEAMATGTPVVSTPLGAEGLSCIDGEHIVIADTAPAMARAIVGLLRDRDACIRVGSAGRRLVEERYSWDASAAVIQDEIMRVVTPFEASSNL